MRLWCNGFVRIAVIAGTIVASLALGSCASSTSSSTTSADPFQIRMVLSVDASGCRATNPKSVPPPQRSTVLFPPSSLLGPPCLKLGPALLTLSHVESVETGTSPGGPFLSIRLLPVDVSSFDALVHHAGDSSLAFVILGQVLSLNGPAQLAQPAALAGTIQIAGMSPSDRLPTQIAEALHAKLVRVPGTSSSGTSTTTVSVTPASEQPSLSSVSCIPRGECVVVGGTVTLFRSNAGSVWSKAAAGQSLNMGSVSCIGPSRCLAIGSSGPTGSFEQWDGQSWATLPAPPSPAPPSGSMNESGPLVTPVDNLSCTTTSFCVGVGGTAFVPGTISGPLQAAVIEVWTNGRWSSPVVLNPEPPAGRTVLSDVSCVSTTFCVAVGNEQIGHQIQGLVEAWDGRQWQSVPAPPENGSAGLDSVSCTSFDFCLAVGTVESGGVTTIAKTRVIADVWNGSSWATARTPSDFGQGTQDLSFSVPTLACTSMTHCLATWTSNWVMARQGGPTPAHDGFPAASELWNGSSWESVPMPNPTSTSGEFNILSDESCVDANACVAVGTTTDGFNSTSLIESWGGSHWTIDPLPRL